MSPRKLDPETRTVLIDTAARLIAEVGPAELTTRRLAAEAGTSTMAIYTYFGSMGALVREIAQEGFGRLAEMFAGVAQTDDAVADMTYLGRVYRFNAITNRHLYNVMFGGQSLGGFALSEEDRQYGRYTLGPAVDCAVRCIEAGRFCADDPALIAQQLWLAIHGTITLELGGYLTDPYPADACFEAQLVNLVVGAGDERSLASASVAFSARRFRDWRAAMEAAALDSKRRAAG